MKVYHYYQLSQNSINNNCSTTPDFGNFNFKSLLIQRIVIKSNSDHNVGIADCQFAYEYRTSKSKRNYSKGAQVTVDHKAF